MQNTRNDYIDLIPIDLSTQPMLEGGTDYNGTNRVPLVRLYYDSESPYGLQSGVHISCNHPGYCLISTNIEPTLPEQNWLDRCIILTELNKLNPRSFYLAKLYSTCGNYWEKTHGTIINDGSKVLWASNWNQNVGQEQVFLIQADIPQGVSPSATPTPQITLTPTPEPQPSTTPLHLNGDVNMDGEINSEDLILINEVWHQNH